MNNYLVRLILLTIIFSGCKKMPEAEFHLKQYEYAAGDAIQYENLSLKYHSCQWDIMNENNEIINSFDGSHPNIVTSILSDDGVNKLRLSAYSKRQKKEAVIDKLFLIKSNKYYLTVNANGSGPGVHTDFKIYVDNQFIGDSNFDGTFQTEIPTGLRLVKLVSSSDSLENAYDFLNDVSITF